MAIRPDDAIKPLTVQQLNGRIHDLLAARFQSVLVKGEVSGVSPRTGHVWFTLKDAAAALSAVIFSGTARRLPFLPENGQELVVTGQVDFHVQTGRVTLVVSRLDYDGAGKVRQAIEALKRRLDAEGAFDPRRKRSLPFLPRCVALVTSPSGAVIHDLQQTIWERFPNVPLVVYAALVQGVASQRSLVAALRQCDRDGVADVCIVARGGGSFEELMAFNQEAVVRAIQAMRIPVITALGHTSDRTLADLVADREARTPTAAAELVVPKKADLLQQLGERGQRLQRAGRSLLIGPGLELEARRQRLTRLSQETASRRQEKLDAVLRMLRQRDPREVLRERERTLADSRRRLEQAVVAALRRIESDRVRIGEGRERLKTTVLRALRDSERSLESRRAGLLALGPEQTLARGYSICLDEERGNVVRRADDVERGRQVKVVLSAGDLGCRVEEVRP